MKANVFTASDEYWQQAVRREKALGRSAKYITNAWSLMAASIEAATGRKPVFIGKPDPTMIRLAWEQTGYGPEETLMVGDRLYTDIACGVNAGTDTVLVLTGEATAADAAVSETPPTLVCRDMAELLEQLQRAYQKQEELL